MSFDTAVERTERAIDNFKLAVWTLVALVGPLGALLMENYLGVFIMGMISAMIGRFAFGKDQNPFRGSRILGRVMVVQGLALGLYGGDVLLASAKPWTKVAGGRRTSLVLTPTGAVYGVELTEKPTGFLSFDPLKKSWSRVEFPGDHIAVSYLAEDGKTIVAPEDRSDQVYFLRDESFEMVKWPRNKEVTEARRTADCAGMKPLPFSPSLCVKTATGARWLAKDGPFRGHLAFSPDGKKLESVSIPGPRPEALVVNPSNPNELWIAFWGSGVYRTLDRGKIWKRTGLRGSEVTSLVVDFVQKRAYASTGSGIFALDF